MIAKTTNGPAMTEPTTAREWWDYYYSHPYHPELGWLNGTPNCPCGQSVEDCGGECYEWSLLHRQEPADEDAAA